MPDFQRPFLNSPTSGVNLQSILWSIFFQSPALQSSPSRRKSSKRPFFGTSTASMINNDLGGVAFNTTTALPLAKKPMQPSTVASKTEGNSRISPQASLLLHGGRQSRHRVETETKRMKRISFLDSGGWRFILVVSARHLRNCILSEVG